MKKDQGSIEKVKLLINNPLFVRMVTEKGKEKMRFVIRKKFSEYNEEDIIVACHIVNSMKDAEKMLSLRKHKIWENIEKESFSEEKVAFSSSVIGDCFRAIGKIKHAIVVVLAGILIGGYFFKDDILITLNNNTPVVVNNIEVGKNKATLTLGNGLEVILENGANFQAENLSSNGKEIVYNTRGQENATEIEFNYLTVPRGGQYFVKLSDGTQVRLNSESQLKYPVSFINGETREVELVYGEAYFDVSPGNVHNGAKFKVYNKSQEVEVLGTKFNIKAYKDEPNVYTTLIEGKIIINTLANKQVLAPNEQSILNVFNSEMEIVEVDIKGEIAWVNGDFVFQGKTLKDIMKVLSRWYNVSIEFQNKEIEKYKFNGELSKSQDLEEILLLIKNTNFISNYEIKEKTIILK
ncbi:FecR family protein [Flavivirga jejuensis]|uniref:FecR family protein n=1 Tax=Flavivirga jejuensis TaxID=870487 RepID=A0ABT8WUZ3_9FLAO|nr:FecR family protein [Flavivirga jejuensis]MDO5976980.1 FecR family protein [Flavivirga jejuensis]